MVQALGTASIGAGKGNGGAASGEEAESENAWEEPSEAQLMTQHRVASRRITKDTRMLVVQDILMLCGA